MRHRVMAAAIFVVLVALAALVAGCGVHDPVEKSATSNAAMGLDLLFEHDGVRVYRFLDAGRHHYYAVTYGSITRQAPSVSTFSTWSENCGKNCTRTVTDEIPTLKGNRN
jgi:hypothetical protein